MALGTVLVLVATPGCGDDEGAPSLDATDPGERTEETTQQVVLDAYAEYWTAHLEAFRSPEPPDPAMAAATTGELREEMQRRLQDYADKGLALVGTIENHPRVVKLEHARAEIRDCIVNRADAVVVATGQVDLPADPDPVTFDAVMVLDAGRWRLAESFATTGEEGRCEPLP